MTSEWLKMEAQGIAQEDCSRCGHAAGKGEEVYCNPSRLPGDDHLCEECFKGLAEQGEDRKQTEIEERSREP